MEIKYLGHSSFFLKGRRASVVTDPYHSEITGYKFPKHISSQIVTVSHDHPDHNAVELIEDKPFVISGCGEYDVEGVSVRGFLSFHDEKKGLERGMNIIYRIEMDNLAVVHLGDLGHTLESKDIDMLDGVDILFVPIGGQYTIGIEQAEEIINEIEPSIVIPMHYKRAESNQKEFGMLAGVDEFIKALGKEIVAPQPKLLISKDKLPAEMQVIVLE